MRLLTCRTTDGETLGVAVGERWQPVSEMLPDGPSTMLELLAGGPDVHRALADAVADADLTVTGRPLAEAPLMAPLPRPGKIIAIGRNYREHAAEEGVDPPAAPLIFSKWPSCVIGPGEDIRWDPALTGQVDYEAELAVVIGRTARHVTAEAPSTTSSDTRASTTSRRATSSSATGSGRAASRSRRSARWGPCSSRRTRSATRSAWRSAAPSTAR